MGFKKQQLTLCNLVKENGFQSFKQLIDFTECKNVKRLENLIQFAIQDGLIIAKFDFESEIIQVQEVDFKTFENQNTWIHFKNKLRSLKYQIKSIILTRGPEYPMTNLDL